MNRCETLEKRDLDVGRIHVPKGLKHAIRLRFDRACNRWRSMTEQDGTKARCKVDVSIAIDVAHVRPFARREKDGGHVRAAHPLSSIATMSERGTLDPLETIERAARCWPRRRDANVGQIDSRHLVDGLRKLAERHALGGTTTRC